MRQRQSWHRLLNIVAWVVLLAFVATFVGSSIISVLKVLQ